ncbi:peptide-methionine (S)-S-oxide reductase MsrA [Lacticigenium naphthae]|uniref:peptide-methionine (S)-S-oxide reductase MsrA n=1 Tax=Lacticigenium naphthae TaxID=515351 RepID=UPI00041C4BFB|nr:peptide-methionine (S)-S-oxide reductase MsrA [Lacticigenium naphthae]
MNDQNFQKATFAGGCFWCMVHPFDEIPGIEKVTSGYTGGDIPDPTYREVTTGTTGHTEAIQILYDPEKISFEELVEIYWRQTDPTDASGQFADRGSSYRPVIFYHNEKQKEIAQASKKTLEESGRFLEPIVTTIEEAKPFYEAEEYHQDYYKKAPVHYKLYNKGSGRAGFIKDNWK